MLKILDGLARAAVGTALLPVDAVVDVVTLGGALTGQDEPRVARRARQIGRAVDDAVDR